MFLRLTLSKIAGWASVLVPNVPRAQRQHCAPARSSTESVDLAGFRLQRLCAVLGGYRSRLDFVLETIRIKAVEAAVGRFGLRVHEVAERLAT
jgi:hypothetical protein